MDSNTNARAGLALAADRLVDGGGDDAEQFGRHAPALASYRQSMCFRLEWSLSAFMTRSWCTTRYRDHRLRRSDQAAISVHGFPRLGGRLLRSLLYVTPNRQSSEELAAALRASSGGISTNARMLSQFGFIERLAVAGDRRSYFRLRPHAFAAGERQRIRTMADLRAMADAGLHAMRGSPPERGRRLQEMRDLSAYMETVLTNALDQFGDQTKRQPMRTSAIGIRWLTRCCSAEADTTLTSV